MKLKTIKDIVSWTCECNCVTFDNEICRACGKSPKYGEINYDDIKAEAIKDYKAIQKKNKKWTRQDVLNYIKWKNNLTEKDLEEKG